MTLLLFVILNFCLLVFCRGFLIFIKLTFRKSYSVDNLYIAQVPLYIFFPIFSLFFIGNISLIANFFVSIEKFSFLLIPVLFLFFFLNFKEKFNIENKVFLVVSLLIIPSILAISSYGLKLHYDSVDYHINFQYWLRKSKIVFGLTNLYVAYGWSTIYEYILANFWINNKFLGLHYVNVVFFTFFYNFISYNLLFSKNLFLKFLSLNILIYSLLDNFGAGGGGNGFLTIQMVGKPDLAVGITFFICFSLFLNDYLKNKFSVNNFIIISILALFSFQIKIVSAFLIVPLLFYILKLNNLKVGILQKFAIFSLIFNFIAYIVKNIIISGCLVFPIKQSCISMLDWTNKIAVGEFSDSVTNGNYRIRFDENIVNWFNSWISNAYNVQVYSNLVFSFLIIWLFNKVLFKQIRNKYTSNEKISLLLIFLFVTVFFLTGPTVRYGFGTFLIAISAFSVKQKILRNELTLSKNTNLIFIIILLSVGLTPRIYSYVQFIENPFGFAQVTNSSEEYLNKGSLKDIEIQNVSNTICYIQKPCVKNSYYKSIILNKDRGYLFYKLTK